MTTRRSPITAPHLHWSGRTDRGKVRPNNEDAFVGLQFNATEIHRLGRFGEASTKGGHLAFAVSDGLGGALAGDFASRIVVEKITTLLPREFRLAASWTDAGFADALKELFRHIHTALTHVGGSYAECAGMEATLSLCWFTPKRLHFAHIGDSRIYYLPACAGVLKQLSQDDTHVGWLYRQGQLNERQARSHPRRKVLQKALGGGHQFVDPQVGSVAYQPGDVFLLCTDGLVEGLYDSHLTELLRLTGSGDAAHRLVEESLAKDGSDNTTALVIQVE